MKKVREFHDYRRFVEAQIEAQPVSRGYRTRLAEIAGCQPAYLSQVLAGRANMTPDQASNLADHWQLDETDSDYFLGLVELERAGSSSLVRRLKSKLKRMREEFQKDLATYQQPSVEETTAAELYYSSFLYSAIHVLLSVDRFQLIETLAEHLGVAQAELMPILKTMREQGLVQSVSADQKQWRQTQKNIHAVSGTFYSALHHRNWRLKAIDVLSPKKNQNLHYTAVYSLSKSDLLKLKEMLLTTIDETRAVVEPSREEAAACLLIDWFEI